MADTNWQTNSFKVDLKNRNSIDKKEGGLILLPISKFVWSQIQLTLINWSTSEDQTFFLSVFIETGVVISNMNAGYSLPIWLICFFNKQNESHETRLPDNKAKLGEPKDAKTRRSLFLINFDRHFTFSRSRERNGA